MKLVLLRTPSYDTALIRDALEAESIEERVVDGIADLVVRDNEATVFVLDAEKRAEFRLDILGSFIDAGGAIIWTAAPEEHDVPDDIPDKLIAALLRHPI